MWFRERCDPYKDAVLPDAPSDVICELSRRYILLYELITGARFVFPSAADMLVSPDERLSECVRKAVASGRL